jgi:hypothetical protein
MEGNKIFSELGGFVIYEPLFLEKYITDNKVSNNDLLSHFTSSNEGDLVTGNGSIIPITGVPPDYYSFKIIEDLPPGYLVESPGWVLHVLSGGFRVIGIGYLTDVAKMTGDKSLSFSVPNGWYKLSITSYLDEAGDYAFGLKLTPTPDKPVFSGDMETNYGFE